MTRATRVTRVTRVTKVTGVNRMTIISSHLESVSCQDFKNIVHVDCFRYFVCIVVFDIIFVFVFAFSSDY